MKTWFITGASRGFGHERATAALDRVAATARDLSTLDDLVGRYGDAIVPLRLDVVVDNADYGRFGMIEELSEAVAAVDHDAQAVAK